MSVPIFTVDAFTDRPFSGNPAAVCLLEKARDEAWMRSVAAEMNLSETAFLLPGGDGFHLRWLSPTVEVDLCGHATLAAAHVLWEERRLRPGEQAVFHTRSGRLTADKTGEWIELDFPTAPAAPAKAPDGLLAALGTGGRVIGLTNLSDYLVELRDEAAVRAVAPDLRALAALKGRGVIVTARAETTGFDYVHRYFAPAFGIDEDPVTGSIQCTLGPYWSSLLGKGELTALQVSARTGVLRVRPAGDRVRIGGQAVTVLRGSIG